MPGAMRLRVLTFNVWNTEGDPRRPQIINRAIRQLDPDLIALQEVVQTAKVEALDTLLAGLGFHATHQADVQQSVPRFSERYGGTAVATRWPHEAVELLDVRLAGVNDVPWATLAVAVRLPALGEILFLAPTAAWRPSAEAVRERQAIAITDLDARHRRDLPTVIAGDFNAAPDASSIRYLTGKQSLDGRSVLYHDAWALAGNGPGYTWSSENPNARAGVDQIVRQPAYRSRFDYVFVGSWDAHPNAHARVLSAELACHQPVEGIWASDHFGVVVDLEVGAEGKAPQADWPRVT